MVKSFLGLFLLLLALMPTSALAGAWVKKEGEGSETTSIFYHAPYKSNFSSSSTDASFNDFKYNISNKTSSYSLSNSLEYGLTPDITLIGDVYTSRYDDEFEVKSQLNGAGEPSLKFKINYYDVETKLGFKGHINQGDYDALSYQFLLYPGNLIAHDKSYYLRKKLSGKLSLLYGSSFNIPFGMNSRPDYGNYIDLESSIKYFPRADTVEYGLSANIGIRPFNKEILFVFGLDNTFNGYNCTKRPFSNEAITNTITSLGLSQEVSSALLSSINSNLKVQGNSPYSQINLQIGYNLNDTNIVTLQSLHNVFKNKPFTYNTYYITLEHKF
ncbi:MAG: hypothetical protein K0R73_145 [Candidatus Midichloriaceae bacterium]|jgi:hypothetical protein|nr:hypothetical protein [Candidatus Midichloriaceae bacterium]